MLNKVFIMGRLCTDPEERKTQNGVSVTTFTLAIDRPKKDGESTGADFIDCVAWRQTAEFICRYFKKGSPMLLEGHLQSRRWEDKDGNKRKAVEVVVGRIEFVGGRRDDVQKAQVNAADTFQEIHEYKVEELPF